MSRNGTNSGVYLHDTKKKIPETEAEPCHVVDSLLAARPIVGRQRATFEDVDHRTQTSDIELLL
jgi:hypothetical protein